MLAGIREVLVVVNPEDESSYKRLLGDGAEFGIKIAYVQQQEPLGIPHALTLVPEDKRSQRVLLMLGDNLFFGSNVGTSLSLKPESGALAFGVNVPNPSDFGVVTFDAQGNPSGIVEKPTNSESNIAIPGIYFLDSSCFSKVKGISPSSRGELEITDLLLAYLNEGALKLEILPRGTAWLDTGKASSLARASQFVEAIEANQGLLVGSPHEVAWRQGWIDTSELLRASRVFSKSDYGAKLELLAATARS
jgi:glucose-1-phosphate thymidylyltransferase